MPFKLFLFFLEEFFLLSDGIVKKHDQFFLLIDLSAQDGQFMLEVFFNCECVAVDGRDLCP